MGTELVELQFPKLSAHCWNTRNISGNRSVTIGNGVYVGTANFIQNNPTSIILTFVRCFEGRAVW
jgi:hypothetical protein